MEILAKQLVKVRNQKAQSFQASGHIQSLATQNTMMASNMRMADAMQVRFVACILHVQAFSRLENIENNGKNE